MERMKYGNIKPALCCMLYHFTFIINHLAKRISSRTHPKGIKIIWNRRSLTEWMLSACRYIRINEGSNVELVALRAMLSYIIKNYSSVSIALICRVT
jgi:hypothetical protein